MLTNKNIYNRLEKVSLLFLIDQSSQLQTGLEAESDLCQHVCHFLLHQLIPCQWNSKLDSGAGNEDTVSSSRLSINNQIHKYIFFLNLKLNYTAETKLMITEMIQHV